jgi:hypothetical protein
MNYEAKRLFRWLGGVLLMSATAVAAVPANAAVIFHSNGQGACALPQGTGTVTRKALCLVIAALRSPGMPRVIAFLSREQATKEQVGLVVKHAASTAKILDELAAVRGQVHGGLVKLGVAQSNASRVAYWIEKALDWGL